MTDTEVTTTVTAPVTKGSSATIRTKKFRVNKLLKRKQMIVEVLHPGQPNVPKLELRDSLARMHKVDPKVVILYGLKTKFGGGSSRGFALIYDDLESLEAIEHPYRLIRHGLKDKVQRPNRKTRKERRHKANRIRGKYKAVVLKGIAPPKRKGKEEEEGN